MGKETASNHSRIKGPYESRVEHLVAHGYPNLSHLYSFMGQSSFPNLSTGTAIDFTEKNSIDDVQKNLKPSDIQFWKPGTGRTLFIIEDLSSEWIEQLGWTLAVEPQFFANQLGSETWSSYWNGPDRFPLKVPDLPSVSNSGYSTTIKYIEPVVLRTLLREDTHILAHMNVFRPMEILNTDDADSKSSIGLVHRTASLWYRRYGNGFFEAILLTDPVLSIPLSLRSSSFTLKSHWDPLHRGYVDFSQPSTHLLSTAPNRTSVSRRASLRAHMEAHLTDPSSYLPPSNPIPTSSKSGTPPTAIDIPHLVSSNLQRIALSNLTLLLAHLSHTLSPPIHHNHHHHGCPDPLLDGILPPPYTARATIPLRPDPLYDAGADDMLARSVRRAIKTQRLLARLSSDVFAPTLASLELDATQAAPRSRMPSSSGKAHHMAALAQDWHALYAQLTTLQVGAAQTLQTLTSATQVLATLRGASQAGRLERLGLGMEMVVVVLAPVAVGTGLMGMTGDFGVGGAKWWISWCVILGLVVVMAAVWWVWGWGARVVRGSGVFAGRWRREGVK